jgi:hypothetical protein
LNKAKPMPPLCATTATRRAVATGMSGRPSTAGLKVAVTRAGSL